MKKFLVITAWLLATCCYFTAKSACDGTGGFYGNKGCMTDRDCSPGKRCINVQNPKTHGWHTECQKCPSTT